MSLRPLLGLIAAALLAVPTAASAITLTVEIDGLALFGLGQCDFPIHSMPCSAPPVGISDISQFNTPPSALATLGLGQLFDQVILGSTSSPVDVPLGIPALLDTQPFAFVVGDTGGGSAGPDPFPATSIGGYDYSVNLARSIRVCDQSPTPICLSDQTIVQLANLNVDWFSDTLTIFASAPIAFDLTSFGPGLGSLTIILGAVAPITAFADPDGEIPVQAFAGNIILSSVPTAIPVPSTLALVGLGLAGFANRRRRQRA